MKDYSEEQQKEFEKLHQEALRIKKNLETDFYLEKSRIERGEIIKEEARWLIKYSGEVPLDVKKSYRGRKRINIAKLTEELYEVKTK